MSTFPVVRFRAAKLRDYFSMAIFAMYDVPKPGLGTFAIDRYGRVYYDPDIIGTGPGKWTVEQAAWVLIHEVGHWIRKHHERADLVLKNSECIDCDAALVNISEDAEINDDLVAEGARLPGDHVTPQKLGLQPNQLWEHYYYELKKRQQQQPQHAHQKKLCGSAAHGVSQDYELPAPGTPTQDGDKAPGIGNAEGDLLRRQIAQDIMVQAQRDAGSVPAGWRRWAQSVLAPPKVAWEKELSALVKNAVVMATGCVDFNYTRPARRKNDHGIILPRMRRPQPDAAVVIDTSGSMGEHDLSDVLREVRGIIRAVGQRKIPVICCDAAAAPVQRVSDAFQIELIGGGGTNMGVGIAEAERIGARVVVVLTDGYTPWPEHCPKPELVICLVGTEHSVESARESTPAYAKRVLTVPRKEKQAA